MDSSITQSSYYAGSAYTETSCAAPDYSKTSRHQVRPGLILILLLIASLFLYSTSVLAARPMPLITAIDALQTRGHRFLYSSELVTDQIYINVEDLSIRSLQIYLPSVSLKMKRVGLLWVITASDSEQQSVSGYLLSLDGEPIANGRIRTSLAAKEVFSRLDGYFEIELDATDGELEFEAPGYQKQVLSIEVAQQSPIILMPDNWIESLIVTGSRYRLPLQQDFISSIFLSSEEMQLVPALGGDSLRMVTRLPGISSVGVSAKPRIRGGLQDELLVLLDGVELIEPFHLSDFHSVFSTIDDRAVESVDFYTGGFPVRYGNRMSGVMDISTAMPVTEAQTELGMSLFSTFVNTRGYSENGIAKDWIFSVRRGNLADISSITSSDWGQPKYLDAFARVGLTLSETSKIYFGAVAVLDDIELNNDEETAKSDIDSFQLWSRFEHQLGDAFYTALVVSLLQAERKQSQVVIPEAEDVGEVDPETPGYLDYRQQVQGFALRNDYSLGLDKHQLEFGIQLDYGRAEYDYQSQFERGFIGELLGGEERVSGDLQVNPRGWSGGLYASAQLQLTPRLTLQPGIRWDFQDYSDASSTQHTSPRIGLLYDLGQHSNVRLSIGRFYQPQGIHELQVVDGIEHFFDPQKSDQAIISFEWENENIQIKTEAYYKRYRDQKPRFENLFNSFVLLPHMEADRIKLEPEKGLVKGFEIESRFEITPELSAQLRYSYMDAADRINGKWVARRWSQQHTVHGGIFWQRDSFDFAAGFTWHTGWRTSLLPPSVATDAEIMLENLINNQQLRNYFSVDISMSKTWQLGNTHVTLHADIINLMGRNNIAGVEYDVDEQEQQVFFSPGKKNVLPLAPSIGVIIVF